MLSTTTNPQYYRLSVVTRPQTFSEVVGQPLAVETLKRLANASMVVTSSIVMQGSYGSGKTTLSKIFAKAVNCEFFKSTGDVCNECAHCQSVNSGNSFLYQEYDATQVGNVESIKNLIEMLSFRIPDGSIRVITLDEVHSASVQAMTALLKVIEEGIPNTVFVFCTTEDLMKTIMSRSCVIPIFTVSDTEMHAHVRKVADAYGIAITDTQIDSIVIKSMGHVRDAMQILDHFSIAGDKAIETPYELIKTIFLSIFKKQPIDSLLKELSTYQTSTIAPTIALFLRNCFSGVGAFETRVRDTGNAKALFNHFYTPQIRQALTDEYGVQLAFLTLIH